MIIIADHAINKPSTHTKINADDTMSAHGIPTRNM